MGWRTKRRHARSCATEREQAVRRQRYNHGVEPLVEYELELGGYATRALELEGKGPPLLFLHGFADSADTWRLVLERLARAGRRALAVDLPGFATAGRLKPRAGLPPLDAVARAAADRPAGETGGGPGGGGHPPG